MRLRSVRPSLFLSAPLLALGLVAALGCGPAADGAPSAVDEAPQEAGPTVASTPLEPEVLAAYLPESALGLPRRAADANLAPARDDGGRSFPGEARVGYGPVASESLEVAIVDMAGTGAYLEGQRQIFQLQVDGEVPTSEGEIEARRLDDGTILVTRVNAGAFQAPVEMLIADRFRVTITLRRDGSPAPADRETVEELVELYRSGLLGRLVDAPARPLAAADWLGVDDPSADVADASAIAIRSCDELLPPRTVATICGVAGVEVRPTPGMEEGGGCSRRYVAGSGGSGLVFLLTRYEGAAGASRASAAAALGDEPGDYAVSHDRLPDLGDGGSRVQNRSEAIPDDYRVRFSRGPVLVELNTADSPLDGPDQKVCTDLEALTRLAEAIDTKLAGGR